MKTKGRRESTNIVDISRPGAKGARLKPTPKRTLPVELEGTRAMSGKLSIEAFKARRRRDARMHQGTILDRETFEKRKRKPKG